MTAPESAKLKKQIGLITLVSIGAGSMIGSGIFALPALMAAAAGPGLVLAIIGSAIVTLFLAMPYAELGAAFPLTGGPYSLPRLALGDTGGFVVGWGYFLNLFIGTGAVLQIFVVYLGLLIPGLADGQTLTWTGTFVVLGFLWAFTIINLLGVKWGGLFAVVTMFGRLIPLFIFVIWGLIYFQGRNFSPMLPFGWTGVTIGVTLFFWAYTSFETVVVPSGEVKNPARTIPRAVFLSVLLSTVVYVLIAIVFVGMLDWKVLGIPSGDWKLLVKEGAPLADVATALGLPILAIIVVIGAILATAGGSGDRILVQGRIPFAMAADGLFWKRLAEIHPRFGTPFNALLFASGLATILVVTVRVFVAVTLMAAVCALVAYAAAAISVPILRKTRSDINRPFKLPQPKLIAGIGFVFATWSIYWASWPWSLVGSLLVFTGFVAILIIRPKGFEFKRNVWLGVYLFGISFVSLVGDVRFLSKHNFLPVTPFGWLPMPWDLVTLTVFALVIFRWAYAANTKSDLPKIKLPELHDETAAESP